MNFNLVCLELFWLLLETPQFVKLGGRILIVASNQPEYVSKYFKVEYFRK